MEGGLGVREGGRKTNTYQNPSRATAMIRMKVTMTEHTFVIITGCEVGGWVGQGGDIYYTWGIFGR